MRRRIACSLFGYCLLRRSAGSCRSTDKSRDSGLHRYRERLLPSPRLPRATPWPIPQRLHARKTSPPHLTTFFLAVEGVEPLRCSTSSTRGSPGLTRGVAPLAIHAVETAHAGPGKPSSAAASRAVEWNRARSYAHSPLESTELVQRVTLARERSESGGGSRQRAPLGWLHGRGGSAAADPVGSTPREAAADPLQHRR